MPAADASMESRIRAAAADILAKHRIPGISVAVVKGDDVIFCESFGHADIETQEPLTPDRRQRIASITKTMVGLCTMALVEEGKLQLDTPVTALLPELQFHGPAEAITIKHLLTHTSGIGEAPTRDRLVDIANPDRNAVESPGDFSTLYPDGIVIEVPPGEKWSYCNNGYGLLGEIITRAEGASLQEVMHRRIWQPLGMSATDILDQNDERITSCYHRAPNEDTTAQLTRAGIPVKDQPTVDGLNVRGSFTAEFNQGMRAAGGVQSTLPDMAKYASALLRNAANIVRPATYDQVTARQHGDDDRMVSWGLSLARVPLRVAGERPSEWKQLIGHGGAYFGGWNSHLDVIPDLGIGIIQHMNIMLDEPAPIFRQVIRAVLDAESPRYGPTAADPEVLARAPGTYELPMPGPLTNFRPQTRIGRINIAREGDSLRLESRWGSWKSGAALVPCDPDDPTFFAVQRPEGDPAYLRFDLGEGQRPRLLIDDLTFMYRRPDGA